MSIVGLDITDFPGLADLGSFVLQALVVEFEAELESGERLRWTDKCK